MCVSFIFKRNSLYIIFAVTTEALFVCTSLPDLQEQCAALLYFAGAFKVEVREGRKAGERVKKNP